MNFENQINELREAFNKIDTIDPESKYYKKFIAFLDSLPQQHLKLLAQANIKFLSKLAQNRIKE